MSSSQQLKDPSVKAAIHRKVQEASRELFIAPGNNTEETTSPVAPAMPNTQSSLLEDSEVVQIVENIADTLSELIIDIPQIVILPE